jgi:hypothetical protein
MIPLGLRPVIEMYMGYLSLMPMSRYLLNGVFMIAMILRKCVLMVIVWLDSMNLVKIRWNFGGKAKEMGWRCPKFAA